jgi:hypothetical protein
MCQGLWVGGECLGRGVLGVLCFVFLVSCFEFSVECWELRFESCSGFMVAGLGLRVQG